ncbi:MAG: DUF4350 domain-containing protein [Gammaproteobacteria bacterium]|nr:DUF4350 domain-containing protein [Gammaproteobacteria bacterium]
MKERLTTLLMGLAALYVAIMLIVPPRPSPVGPKSWPTSADHGRYGLLGLQRWLARSGVPTVSLRRRYDQLLHDRVLPATGNLLIMSLPQRWPARVQERRALQRWLARGNRVLVLAADGNVPPWALGFNRSLPVMLADLGFRLVPKVYTCGVPAASRGRLAPPGTTPQHPIMLEPQGDNAVLKGVARVATDAETVASRTSELRPVAHLRFTLPLLRDARTGAPAFWEVRVGAGAAWISRFADLFDNALLDRQDNARLIAHLVGASLGPGGRVIFDDMHQGLSVLYDPRAFFHDPRLHYSLWFILAFWLLYLIGRSSRLGPLTPAAPAPRAVDFVRAVGGLYARRLEEAAVAKGMLAHFFNEIRVQRRLPQNGKPVWEALARSPRIGADRMEALRGVYYALERGAGCDLMVLTNMIRDIRSRLL